MSRAPADPHSPSNALGSGTHAARQADALSSNAHNAVLLLARRRPAHPSQTSRCAPSGLRRPTHPPPHHLTMHQTPKPASQLQPPMRFRKQANHSISRVNHLLPRSSRGRVGVDIDERRTLPSQTCPLSCPLRRDQAAQPHMHICGKASGFCRCTLSVSRNMGSCELASRSLYTARYMGG